MNKKRRVNVIQVYAPTSSYEDDVMEEFFDQVSTTIENHCKRNSTTVLGDFNATVGQKQKGETNIDNFGLSGRKHRGQMTIKFALRNGLNIMITFFQSTQEKVDV